MRSCPHLSVIPLWELVTSASTCTSFHSVAYSCASLSPPRFPPPSFAFMHLTFCDPACLFVVCALVGARNSLSISVLLHLSNHFLHFAGASPKAFFLALSHAAEGSLVVSLTDDVVPIGVRQVPPSKLSPRTPTDSRTPSRSSSTTNMNSASMSETTAGSPRGDSLSASTPSPRSRRRVKPSNHSPSHSSKKGRSPKSSKRRRHVGRYEIICIPKRL